MQVHLVRTRDSTTDDIITVRKRVQGDYLVRYVDGILPHTVWVNSKTESELLDYIENILMFFQVDHDPFISLQVTLPGWPIIYIRHKDIDREIILRIMDSIEMYLKNSPASFRE
jgi:hypothetical protein